MAIGINLSDEGDFYGYQRKNEENHINCKKLLSEILIVFNKLPNTKVNNTTTYRLAEKIEKLLKT